MAVSLASGTAAAVPSRQAGPERASLQAAALWTALAAAGLIAQLAVIEAGSSLRYQHYMGWARLAGERPLALAVFALQAAAATAGIFHRRREIARWMEGHGGWRLWTAALAFVLTSATVSRDPRAYLVELTVAAAVQSLNLATLALAADSLSHRVGDALISRLLRARRLAWAAALFAVAAAAFLNFAVYDRHPHVQDEVAYLYHARFLASGRLALPAPPAPEGFETYLMQVKGENWFPVTPAGWPAVLALGERAGAAWLVNPVLAGVCLLLAHALLARLYDAAVANLGTLLLAVSPWFLFLGMSYMNHTLMLACALASALCVQQVKTRGSLRWAAGAGAAAGWLSLVRPLDGAILALLLGLWLFAGGGIGRRLSTWAAFAAGLAVTGGLVLPYNAALTGDPLRFPLNAYTDERFGPGSNSLGFGSNRGLGWAIDPYPGHGPLDALVNSNLNATSINYELFGWSAGSLVLVILYALYGKKAPADRLMLALVAAVVAAYSLYYFSGGPDFGARYWFLVAPALIAFSARGALLLSRRGLAGVVMACALTVVFYLPWRATDKYRNYLGMRADVRELAAKYRFGRALVLVRGRAFPDYASAAIYNPLDWNAGAPVYAWPRSPETEARLRAAFAGRPVWVLNGPSLTGGGYEVAEAPR